MATITVSKVKSDGKKADFYIARDESTRTQATGETKEEALAALRAVLGMPAAPAPAPAA